MNIAMLFTDYFQTPISYLTPEIFVTIMACLILIIDLVLPKSNRVAHYLSLATLVGALLITLKLMNIPQKEIVFNAFILDNIGNFLKIVIYVLAMFVFLYSHHFVKDHQWVEGEYYALCLFSILGMMVLISAYSLLSLYLGVELLALPLYALIAMSKDKRATEASMKYFVMGALASGMLLYGISLLYGATGSFEIKTIAERLMQQSALPQTTVLMGMVLILAGLAFKLGAVPFHMWVPDIYEGSAINMTLFIGTLPEVAGFGMAIRLLVDSFQALTAHWQTLWIVMAVLSLALGNIAAIAQTNLKRMLAYSSIGHMGFLFLGLLAGPIVGFAPALSYIVIYSLMALCAFGIMAALSYRGFEAETIADFRGLARTEPWIAFLMLIVMFSLAGVPPTLGFYAKFLVLSSVINAGYLWLAIVAVIFAVISAFYYLRIVRMMYFDFPDTEYKLAPVRKLHVQDKTLLTVNGLLLLGLGIYPAPIINACMAALR